MQINTRGALTAALTLINNNINNNKKDFQHRRLLIKPNKILNSDQPNVNTGLNYFKATFVFILPRKRKVLRTIGFT